MTLNKIFTAAWLMIISDTYAQFTSDRLVVFRSGRGLNALTNASTPVYLDEYTTAGVSGFSLMLDSSGTNALTCSGSATSEGMINLSVDRNKMVIPGYNVSSGISNVSGLTASTALRAVGIVSSSGTFSLVITSNSTFSGTNIRAVVSDGNNYWACGGNNGIMSGTSAFSANISSTSSNNRSVGVFANQLFLSTGTGTQGIYSVGSGTPLNTGNIATLYINTSSGTGNSSPNQFSFNSDTTVCYIADDRSITNGGGIQKWTRTGHNWSLAYTFGTGPSMTQGCRGVTVNWSGTNPLIYATTVDRLITVCDTGSSSVVSTIVTASANTAFRGVCFTPGTHSLPVKLIHFEAVKSGDQVLLKWSTACEMNNRLFEIECSEKQKFRIIGRVSGAGNSVLKTDYVFVDSNPPGGTWCYRLKQVDFDGRYEYSKIIYLNQKEDYRDIRIYPNPFHEQLRISIEDPDLPEVMIELRDLCGKTISRKLLNGKSDADEPLNTTSVPPGIYLIRLESESKLWVCKIVKE